MVEVYHGLSGGDRVDLGNNACEASVRTPRIAHWQPGHGMTIPPGAHLFLVEAKNQGGMSVRGERKQLWRER